MLLNELMGMDKGYCISCIKLLLGKLIRQPNQEPYVLPT